MRPTCPGLPVSAKSAPVDYSDYCEYTEFAWYRYHTRALLHRDTATLGARQRVAAFKRTAGGLPH